MEEKAKQEDDHWQRLREEGIKAKKNESNVSYDILTMQYSQDAGGELQKYQDDQGEFVCEREQDVDLMRDGVQLSEEVMSDDELSCQILFLLSRPCNVCHGSSLVSLC